MMKLEVVEGVVQSSSMRAQDLSPWMAQREDNEGSERVKKSWNPFPIFLNVPAFFSYGKVKTL